MKPVFSPFDAADFLDSDEVIAAYLTEALADDNPDVFIAALGDVAKARGMSQIARDARLGRESLYKALAPGAKPRFETIAKLINSLGVRIAIVPNVHTEPTTLL
jgi:probable addiction module antidote protein